MSPRTETPVRNYIATVPPQEILPVINSRYESTVPGIFLVGDVTGVPLVKVAAKQGKEVIEAIEGSAHVPNDQADASGLDVVIIGAGPAGVAAAIEAAKRGWKYVVLERGRAGSTVRSFPTGKKVYAEPKSMEVESEFEVAIDQDRDDFLAQFEAAIQNHQVVVKEQTEATRVRQVPSGFEVDVKGGPSFPCRIVIVAVGRQGQPKLLNVPGADNCSKVTYRVHTIEDYKGKQILVVGGGNSALEAALLLSQHNEVTLSYRGENFYRAKSDNRVMIEQAAQSGAINVLYNSEVTEIREQEVDLEQAGEKLTLPNDNVVIQIGSLPPIDFLVEMGIELDGIWTRKRVAWSILGLALGIFVYFYAHYFTLLPDKASGKLHVPLLKPLGAENWAGVLQRFVAYVLPIGWLGLLGVTLANWSLKQRQQPPLLRVPLGGWLLGLGGVAYYLNFALPELLTFDPEFAGEGPYFLPGFTWLFSIVPSYFASLSGFYYLLYFTLIAAFGFYWAIRINHPTLWKRNLTIIAVQWTLWWGIPTFLVVFLGTNPWTPLLLRSLNAWPLNMAAFEVDANLVRAGDPAWWYVVGVVGVVWAVVLTFVIIPLFTIKFGKIYCSYICSCGALAETVGNSFRHRGPKGDVPRKLERWGFAFVALAAIATIGSLLGYEQLLQSYNVWVGTFLAGALAIGMYPFLGQRIWCRMWCPLAFWMNFWGRWSQFKITPEPGKCIDCNICNQYCQMGIDIKGRALQGLPVTLKDTPCVGCAECVMRCPMEILHLGDLPEPKLVQIQTPVRTDGEA